MSVLPVAPEMYELNPTVSGEVFDLHPEAAFWIGVVASAGTIYEPELYDAAAQLRANVYIDQMGFLDIDKADDSGRELDDFDDQSIHLVALENAMDGETAKVVGASRIILKKDGSQSLPIESDFAEVFESVPSDIPAVEISRFISRHKNRMMEHAVAVALIRAMTYQILENRIDTAYFEIERPLLGLLRVIGLPLELMSEPKKVIEPHGSSKLYPNRVSVSQIPDSVSQDITGPFAPISVREFFKDEAGNGGLGYFPATLIGGKM